MITIAVAQQKGGVGKTAVSFNLGHELPGRVLLLDADPQSSLSQMCHAAQGKSLYDVIGGSQPGNADIEDIIQEIKPGLDLAPSDISLSKSELGLVTRMGRENVIKKALADIVSRYDTVIIDCPPSLGVLTVASLAAADYVIVPVTPQQTDIRGLALFLQTLDKVRGEINPTLEHKILITKYDQRLIHHRQVIDVLRKNELPLFETIISRSIRVAESMGRGLPVKEHEPDNITASQFEKLAQEVEAWKEA